MKKYGLCILLFYKLGWSAFETDAVDPRNWSLGNSVVSLTGGAVSLWANPAGLAMASGWEAYFGYSNQFGLAELSQQAVAVSYDLKTVGLGIGFANFGKPDFYQEQKITFAAGRKILNNFHLGAGFNYLLQKASGYSSQSAVSIGAGAIWEYEKFRAGVVAKNINQPRLGSDQIPRNYNLGISYLAFDQLDLSAGMYYDTDFKEQFQLGQETRISDNLALRLGFQTEPNRYSLGAGFFLSKFDLDYAFVNHPDLGASHAVGLLFKW